MPGSFGVGTTQKIKHIYLVDIINFGCDFTLIVINYHQRKIYKCGVRSCRAPIVFDQLPKLM